MKFRIARHTNNLKALIEFYCTVLLFEILGEFNDHDGYNGVFIGKKGLDWHLEFTQSDEPAKHSFDEDDLLVFYPETEEEYEKLIANIQRLELPTITPKNPYWRGNGTMVEDPDGFKIVVSGREI